MKALKDRLNILLRNMTYDFFDLMEDHGKMAVVLDALPEAPSDSGRFVTRLSHILRDSANDNREVSTRAPRKAA